MNAQATQTDRPDIPALLNQAVQHHQAGRLAEAERLYRQILAADARQPDALHLLGVIAHQTGQNEAAADLVRQAIEVNGNVASYHNNLGNALLALQKTDEAAAAYGLALALDPTYAEAHLNMGNVARRKEDQAGAAECYKRAIFFSPNYALGHMNLGNALLALGQAQEAVASHKRAVALLPNHPEAHYNLGIALVAAGRADEAGTSFERAIVLKPDYFEAHTNLGDLLRSRGKLAGAAAALERALAFRPDNAEALNNLGNILFEMGDIDGAIARYRQVLALKPEVAAFHVNLGNAFLEQDDRGQAEESYRRALELDPGNAVAHNNLGNILHARKRPDEAIEHYRQAIAAKPDLAEAYWNVGNILANRGKADEAIELYEQGLAAAPGNAEARFYLSLGHFLKTPVTEWDEVCRRFLDPPPAERKYELDLHVRLAIRNWVTGDFAGLQEALARCRRLSDAIGPSSERNIMNMRAYEQFLARTYAFHAARDFALMPPAGKEIVIIGDSHALSYAHTALDIGGTPHKIVSRLVMGCKAWHLATKEDNQFKWAFDLTAAGLTPGTPCLVSLGEIDCRYTEGIIAHYKKHGGRLEDIAAGFVGDFVRHAVTVLRQRGLEVSFLNVPAPFAAGLRHFNKSFTAGEEERLVAVVRLFNDALEIEAARHGCRVVDVYGLTAGPDGRAYGTAHVDDIHLNPDLLARAFGAMDADAAGGQSASA